MSISIIGLIMAIFMLYILLSKYDKPSSPYTLFEQRKLIIAIAIGFVFGFFIMLFFIGFIGQTVIFEYIVTWLILFSFLEETFKLVILNSRLFGVRFDTVFSGVALGLGFASTKLIGVAYPVFGMIPLDKFFADSPVLLALAFNLCVLHAMNGALIGGGTANRIVVYPYGTATILNLINNLLLIFYYSNAGFYAYLSVLAASIYSFLLLYLLINKIIPENIPYKIRKELLRFRRKTRSK